MAALAGVRAMAYRIFAALLLPPAEQRVQWLQAAAGELREHDDALAAFAFFGPWQRLLNVLLDVAALDAAALVVEHVRLFSIDPDRTPSFPYESWYVASSGQDAGWVAVQLQQTYAQAGLHLAPALNESPDHAAVELEFMAHLCGQEAAAWERTATADGLRMLAQERLFLRLHLGRWFGMFARQVRTAAPEPLYLAGVDAADAFIQHDLDLIDALSSEIKRLRNPSVSPGEADGESRTGRPR